MYKDWNSHNRIGISLNISNILNDEDIFGEVINTQGYGSLAIMLQTGDVGAGGIGIDRIYEASTSEFADETVVPPHRIDGILTDTFIDMARTSKTIGVFNTKKYVQVIYKGNSEASLSASSNYALGYAEQAGKSQ